MVATRRIEIPRGSDRINGKRMAITALPSIQDPDFWKSWPGSKTDKGVEKPYERHPWVYAATLALARAISGMPFKIYQGKRPKARNYSDPARFVRDRVRAAKDEKREVSDDHPLVTLFDDPCPALTRAQVWQATLIHLIATAGENFWIMLGKTGRLRKEGEIPTELWPQDPTAFKPLKSDGSDGIDDTTKLVAKWKAGNKVYEPHELVHFTWFNPSNPHRGLAGIEPGRTSLDSDWAAAEFNRQFFRRGCHPGGIFEHPRTLTANQRKDFLDSVSEDHEGLERSHETLLLEHGVKFSWNPRSHKDMEFPELRRSARDEILAVIGVMKSVLAITDDLNYATFLGQKRIFFENTVLPIAFDLEDALYSQLFRDIDGGKYWGEFDLAGVQALQDDLGQKATTAKTFFDMGWSRDEVGARLNLGFDAEPETDVRGGPQMLLAGPAIEGEDEETTAPEVGSGAAASAQAALAGGGSVQDTALNGAQIQSLIDLAAKVQAGEIAPATAIAIVTAAYPTIDQAEAAAIIDPAAKAQAEKPPPPAPPNTEPPAQGKDGDGNDAVGKSAGEPPRSWLAEAQARASDIERAEAAAILLCARDDLGAEDLCRLWKERVAPPLESVVMAAVRGYFGDLEDAQLERFADYVKEFKGTTLTPADVERILFARAEWDAELKRLLGPKLKKVQGVAAKRLGKELGVPAIKATNPELLRVHAQKLGTLVEVNATTKKVIRSKLIAGIAEGESVDELRQRLGETMKTLGGNDRALVIARTEVGMMTQATRSAGMKSAGVERKKWFSVLGPATREDHRKDHGLVVAIADRFPHTGLLHPLEMGGPPGQVVNCDCDLLAVVEGV